MNTDFPLLLYVYTVLTLDPPLLPLVDYFLISISVFTDFSVCWKVPAPGPSAQLSGCWPKTCYVNLSVSATPSWSVLRECGQEPLQFYWFRVAVRFYNALLRSNSDTIVKVLKAGMTMSAVNKKCWSAEFWMPSMVWKGVLTFSIV